MKVFILFLSFFASVLDLSAAEARAYDVTERQVLEIFNRSPSPDQKIGDVLSDRPFASRFFEEIHTLTDLSEIFTGFGKEIEAKIQAIYNRTTKKLIVSTTLAAHFEIYDVFIKNLPWQHRFTASLVKIPGAVIGHRSLSPDALPKDTKVLASLSGVAEFNHNFVLNTPSGDFSVEAEVQAERDDPLYYLRLNYDVSIEGRRYSQQMLYEGTFGKPMVLEIVSPAGSATYGIIINAIEISPDGSLFQNFVQKEDGGELSPADLVGFPLPKRKGKISRRYDWTHPGAIHFLTKPVDGGEMRTLRQGLLDWEDGVKEVLLPDDKIIYLRESGTLTVRVNPGLIDYIEALCIGRDLSVNSIQVNLAEIESDIKLTSVPFKDEDLKILRKHILNGSPGASMTQKIDWDKFVFEVEAQVDFFGRLEFRMEILEQQQRVMVAQLTASSGIPLILQQSKHDDRWRSYVMTCSMIKMTEAVE